MKTELTLEIIRERWSPYSFSPLPVEEFRIKAMFEAAGHAPSSRNEQPWLFVYTTREDEKVFEAYLDFLEESNRIWARNAYGLIVALARTTHAYNGKPNRFALYDTGMAVANLLLQAISFDIYIHQMGGYSPEKVSSYLGLGSDIVPVTVMAMGYLGDGSSLPAEVARKDEQRRPRKQVFEIVSRNSLSRQAFREDSDK
ncbi:MAG: nitroreductase family protein [Bacteroidales bacterium]|jgi:nitroreductase|nr:nitroreductase family protein [Bacteroidales bacterium]